MAGNDFETPLDPKSLDRLHKLQKQWEAPVNGYLGHGDLRVADLRLLLEYFPPLQALIRAIAAGESAPAGEGEDGVDDEAGQLLASAAPVPAPARDGERALRDELARCQAELQQFSDDNLKLAERCRQLQGELAEARRRSAAATPAELALLREDAALADAMGLAALPEDDLQAWTQVVAVLAQRDNLERLWAALKARCEAGRRPASPDERRLLASALAWYNHNWRTRPYRLLEAAPSASYDYETQQRSSHAAAGDTVAELWLSGIADGGGRLLCKALVLTR